MSDEVKVKGLSEFFFAAIPWVLAAGASAWLAFYMAFHDDRKELSQEQRMAVYVGAAERPQAKIAIEDRTHDECLDITRAEYDEPTLLMYAQNRCRMALNYVAWHWELVSPDGTAIKSGYENGATCPIPLPRGKAECVIQTRLAFEDTETRASKLVIWVTENP